MEKNRPKEGLIKKALALIFQALKGIFSKNTPSDFGTSRTFHSKVTGSKGIKM